MYVYTLGDELFNAGVILLDISDGTTQQCKLDLGDALRERNALYSALDRINQRYGRGTLHLASMGVDAVSALGNEAGAPHAPLHDLH